MSLLDKASLIVTPNAYEESKLYSVIPNTTLGDMDVVRATTATRVNSAGLIEVVPRNLFTFSEQFENVNWVKSGVTITANTINSPSGTLTADTFNLASTPTAISRSLSVEVVGTNLVCTASIYLKYKDRQFIQLTWGSGFNGTNYVNVDVINGTITQGVYTTANISQLENGWFRVNITTTGASTSPTLYIWAIDNGTASRAANSSGTGGYYIWGAQLDNGSTATEYFPTTTRLNIPRIDYTNGSCPSLLVEPQRTNLILRSEEFENVSWTKVNTTVTANSINSPSGNLTADTITATGVLGLRVVQTNSISFIASSSYSLTVFAKKGTNNFIQIILPMGIGGMFANFNIDTGVVGTLGTITGTEPTSSIKNLSNNWYRCTINFTSTATTDNLASIAIVTSASALRAESNTLTTSVYLWGAQLETASYASSYIPTIATTVTRNADVISKTGISSLIGQTEGTIYAEIKVNKLIGTASRYIFHISDGTANNRIYMAFSGASSNVLRGRIFNGGTLQCSIDTSTITTTGTYKLALAYKNNDIVFYVNGVQIGVDTSATIPTCSKVDIGHNYAGASQLGDGIANTNIFKTRLTNTELQSLTTL